MSESCLENYSRATIQVPQTGYVSRGIGYPVGPVPAKVPKHYVGWAGSPNKLRDPGASPAVKGISHINRRRLKEEWLLARRRTEFLAYRGRLALPDFLGIGVQKCGTTWLHEVLLRHPGLYLPEAKEINFFSRHLDKGLLWYSNLFLMDCAKKRGEISPSYGQISRRRIRLIRSIMPDVRLVLLLRNPIERAWSHALQVLVKQGNRDVHSVTDAEFIALLSSKNSKRLGDYPQLLSSWLDVFPPEQLFIGLFEDIATSLKQLLYRVFAHIGVLEDIDWDTLPYGKIIIPPAGREFRGHDPSRGVILDGRERTDKLMPPSVREFLRGTYRRDIEALVKNYNLPVEHWAS